MSDEVFDGESVVEKLSKLNSSQQCIESLSRYCVSHRNKAKQIVEFWDKAFNNSQKEQRVSFLYLANDILQNSRRKGSEFVNEFWKVLPEALKYVYQNGDSYAQKAACRLVDIWEERKVFGSRGRNLKNEMLGNDSVTASSAVASVAINGKSSNPIKIVKRDSNSLRIKLAVGGLPEKIITSYQIVNDEISSEEGALSKCKTAFNFVEKIEKDIDYASNQGKVLENVSALVDELVEQENVVTFCINQMEKAETIRTALASQLKEALLEQEEKLELIRSQLQVARAQVDQMNNTRKKLTSPNISEEESKKAAAAAVAAKLTASMSSAEMLTSILSSLVAEESASKTSGLSPPGFPILPSFPPPEKRQKLEQPMPINSFSSQQMTNTIPLAPPSSMKMTFPPLPPQPFVVPYGFGSGPPPPPPLPPLPPPLPPPQHQPQSQPQSSNGGGYYRPPGISFFGQ